MTSSRYKRMVLITESEYSKLSAASAAKNKQPTTIPVDQVQKLHAHNLEEERRQIKSENEEDKTATVKQQLPLSLIRLSIDKFPIYARARAHAILEQLLSDRISWDGEGQVILADGELIDNSNILDIIFYAAADKSRGKLSPPPGFQRLNIKVYTKAAPVVRKRVTIKKPAPTKKVEIEEEEEKISPARKRKRHQVVIGDGYMSV